MAALAAIAIAFLAIPPLAEVPARLLAACGRWIALAAVLELLSMLGFIAVFALVFAPAPGTRHELAAGLRALGASATLPAGGLVGPPAAARTAGAAALPIRTLARSTIALMILTTAPSLLALAGLGVTLWLGWPRGPHSALLSLPVAAAAWAILAGAWLIGRSSAGSMSRPLRLERRRGTGRLLAAAAPCHDGAVEARRLVAGRNWKLVGAMGYYAFDNAVLWAAFHAYGRAPASSVIAMGYLVGSLGSVVPLPAGIGGVEGGLIGALVLYGAPAAPAAGAVLLYRGISLSLQIGLGALAWGLVPARGLRSRYRNQLYLRRLPG